MPVKPKSFKALLRIGLASKDKFFQATVLTGRRLASNTLSLIESIRYQSLNACFAIKILRKLIKSIEKGKVYFALVI